MKSSSTLKDKIDSIAIGGFDGMHKAHQELFKNLSDFGAIVCIETGYANMTPKKYRENYTKYPIFYYDLNEIKELEGFEFIELLKKEFPKLKKIVVGFDFAFGKNRACKIDDLKKLFEGVVVVINEICLEKTPIHSRTIREFLKAGDIKKASNFLGKNYKIVGTQIKGQGLGKKEFVPTINLKIDDFLLPKAGVYISKTKVDDKLYSSVTFLGHRVSTDGTFAVETYILDKNLEVKHENIEIEFFEKIRENRKFDSFYELKNEILKDIDIARKYFY